jgi:hypothetical protein
MLGDFHYQSERFKFSLEVKAGLLRLMEAQPIIIYFRSIVSWNIFPQIVIRYTRGSHFSVSIDVRCNVRRAPRC